MRPIKFKKLFFFLKYTPFHPQWHSFRDELELMNSIGKAARGTLIDIGCANQRLKSYVPIGCKYIALDYYKTASSLYETIPDIYGNAQSLPFTNDCADALTLIEVIEHLPKPDAAFAEAYRVLKVGGELIVTVPFLYPIHDAPYDFQRWTRFGLEEIASHYNFEVREQHYRGQPAETAALLTNIAATKMTLNMLSRYNPVGLLAALCLTIFIPVTNILGWLFASTCHRDGLMPFGYYIKLRKI
jgi:SAM-dependent methyltransferase